MIFRAVEDADLILKARKGDVDAFNLLVSRWDRRVYNYILRLVNSREDALDLSQDTFLKAYQNLKNSKTSPASPRGFSVSPTTRPIPCSASASPKSMPTKDCPPTASSIASTPWNSPWQPPPPSTGSPPTTAKPWSSRFIKVLSSRRWRKSWKSLYLLLNQDFIRHWSCSKWSSPQPPGGVFYELFPIRFTRLSIRRVERRPSRRRSPAPQILRTLWLRTAGLAPHPLHPPRPARRRHASADWVRFG